MDLKSLIRDIPDFPKPGILFRDITTLLHDHAGLSYVVDQLAVKLMHENIDYIVAIESRGFIFGSPLACQLGAGFVPVRKAGKLPAAVYSQEYQLEYGKGCLELHKDALPPGSRVVIVDDLIATGGTALAATQLIQHTQCELVGFAFVVELTELVGRDHLPAVPIHVLIQY